MGSMLYGYFGKVVELPVKVLLYSVGIYQQKSDSEQIQWGIDIYNSRHPKKSGGENKEQ